MVIAEALSTGQTGDERPAVSPTLSTNSRRGNRLSGDQTAGNLLPVLCTHGDGCHEDRRLGRTDDRRLYQTIGQQIGYSKPQTLNLAATQNGERSHFFELTSALVRNCLVTAPT